jgi:hypothetical protein
MKYYSAQDVWLLRAARMCGLPDRQWNKTLCEATVLVPY